MPVQSLQGGGRVADGFQLRIQSLSMLSSILLQARTTGSVPGMTCCLREKVPQPEPDGSFDRDAVWQLVVQSGWMV